MVLSAAAVVLLAGCQSGSHYRNLDVPTQYQSGAEISDALNRSGLGCRDFQILPEGRRDIGEKDAREVGTCRVDGTDASIMLWLKLGEAQDWARSYRSMGCQLARSVGTSPPVYVDGGRWTIAVNSPPVAKRIAAAIGGQAKFPDCGGLKA